MTDEQLSELREVARREGISQAEVVRRALDAYLPRQEPDRTAVRDRFKTLIGAYRSGLSDVSEHHDEYFVEALLARRGHAESDQDGPSR